jgi:hypothetical protein
MRAHTRRFFLTLAGNLEKCRVDLERNFIIESGDHNVKTDEWKKSESGKRHQEDLNDMDRIKAYLEDVIDSITDITEKTVNTK